MAETKTYWFIFQNDTLLMLTGTDSDPLAIHDFIPNLKPFFVRELHLTLDPQNSFYSVEINSEAVLPTAISPVPLRKAFQVLGKDKFSAIVKAYSVINWDKNHQFCGRCATPTQTKPGIFERTCPNCGLSVYPRISPSVIVLIKKDDKLLMARSPHFTPGIFGLIAGFVEIGENLEETVHREVLEEVGIKIKNLKYFGSQPWPFPDSLVVGFTADYAEGEIKIDKHEIEEAGWYRYDQLPMRRSSTVSIAKQLIEHFVTEMIEKHK